MIQELSLVREQLFDAPNEVKESFNKITNYFSNRRNLYDIEVKTLQGSYVNTVALAEIKSDGILLKYRDDGLSGSYNVSKWREDFIKGLSDIGAKVDLSISRDQREIFIKNTRGLEISFTSLIH